MYAASIDSPAIHARRRVSLPAAMAWLLINPDDPDAICGVGRADLDHVADPVADEGLAQGRLVADPARLRIRLRGADDPVGLLILSVLAEANRAAHRDEAVGANLFDQDVVLDDCLELVDPGFFHALFVLRGVILEVLREVAELTGGLDLGCDLRTPNGDELLVFAPHKLEALRCDVDVLSHQFESKSWACPIHSAP